MWLLLFFFIAPALAKITLPQFPGLPTIDDLAWEARVPVSHTLVQTADGYQVMMHRLGNNTGPPVLFQHGLLNAADIWLAGGKDQGQVYLMLKEGYDVYLGNLRGNTFGKTHANLKPSDVRFWDFSFHESGYYDVPAMIDMILSMRGVDQLFYVGHSLGTTVFFVMCSTRPEYNAKIRAAALMSPVAYLPEKSEMAVFFLRLAVVYRHHLWRVAQSVRLLELLPRTASGIKATRDFCAYRRPTQDYCLDLLGMYLGEHRANVDRKQLSYLLSFTPTGTSMKTIYHLGQVLENESFDHFDLGPTGNMERYNSTKAPPYALEQVTAPVGLFWSYNDNLVSIRSVSKLKSRLRNVIWDRPISDPKFSHVDVMIGLNAKEVLYDDVIALLNKYR